MREVVVLAVLAIGVAARAALAEEPQPAKTLAECIAIAVANHPSLKAAAASVVAGQQRVLQAASNYLPQVSANYAADRGNASAGGRARAGTNIRTASDTFNFYSTGVSLTQVLFDFGQTLEQIRAAQAMRESLEADQATQRQTVVLNAKQGYFNLLAARRLLAVANETVHQNQKQLEQAQGRFHVGLAPKFDVTRAQVQLATAELNQITARNNVSVARETLRNALGLTGPVDFDIVDTLDVHEVRISEAAALAAAYDNRPELQSLRAQQRATSEQVAALQKNYLPNLTGNGTYNWTGSDYPLESSWNIGAAVNLSLFNGGLTTAQVGEAKAALAQLRFEEDLTRQNIALEVRQATLNLQQAAESIRVSEKGAQQARENLDLAEGRYRTGVGNIIELTDAQTAMTTADANHVQSLYTYQTAVAAVEKAMARPVAGDE